MATVFKLRSPTAITQSLELSAKSISLYGDKTLHVVGHDGVEKILALDLGKHATKRTTGSKLHYHDGTNEYLGAITDFSEYTPMITHPAGEAFYDSNYPASQYYYKRTLTTDESVDETFDLSNTSTYGIIHGGNRYDSGVLPIAHDIGATGQNIDLLGNNFFVSVVFPIRHGSGVKSYTAQIYIDGVLAYNETHLAPYSLDSNLYGGVVAFINGVHVPVVRVVLNGSVWARPFSVSIVKLTNPA